MSEGLRDTGSSKEKQERSGIEGKTFKIQDFINGLEEKFNLRDREEAEKTEKFFNAISETKISTIGRQEETENRSQRELSQEKETTTEEETEKIKIVPIGKNDRTNNLPNESMNNLRNRDNNSENSRVQETLFHHDLISILKKYGKKANHGLKFTEDFKNFVYFNKDLEYKNIVKLLDIIKTIEDKQIIKKHVIDKLMTSRFSATKISEMSEIEGISLHPSRVLKIMKEYNLQERESVTYSEFASLNKENALDYFKPAMENTMKKINEKRKKNGLPPHPSSKPPTTKEMISEGYRNLLYAMRRVGINYQDIKRGLKYDLIKGNYDHLTKENAAEIGKSKIDDVLKKMNKKRKEKGLPPKQSPSITDMMLYGEKSFILKLFREKISYNEYVLEKNGYQINIDHNKYKNLNKESAKDFLNLIILDTKNKIWEFEGINLDEKETPTLEQFERYDHLKEIYALYARKINPTEIIKELGYIPNDKDIKIDIGKDMHWCVEGLCLEHTRDLNCASFRQIRIKSKMDNSTPDFVIIRDNVFKEQIEKRQNIIKIPPIIEEICVDFFSGDSIEKILEKCLRGYQDYNKLLILVPIRASIGRVLDVPNNPDIFYRENIKIMNPFDFSEFIGFGDEKFKKFKEIVDLTNSALSDFHSRDTLKKMALESKSLICSKLPYSNPEFLEYLKKNNKLYLLESSIPKNKQTPIDLFIDGKTPIKKFNKIDSYINELTDILELSLITKKVAIQLVKKASKNDFIIGRKKIEGIAASALYLSTKFSGDNISILDLCSESGVSRDTLFRNLRFFSNLLSDDKKKLILKAIKLSKDNYFEFALFLKSLSPIINLFKT